MIKRIKTILILLLTSMALSLAFVGCAFLPDDNGSEFPFDNEILAENQTRVNVYGDNCYVRWSEIAGATAYNLYCSESRFGKYNKVCELSGEQDCFFKTSQNKYYYYKATAIVNDEEIAVGEPVCAFSQNTLIVGEDDDMELVQQYIDAKHDVLETATEGQFSAERFCIMLLPGDYPDLDVKVGYYTSVIGLGEHPEDVAIKSLYVSTRVLINNNSTHTFWRSAENFTVETDTQWAVSQATSLRRMQINGDLALSHASGWSSGGFLANSKVSGEVDSGTQQQWMSRNAEWDYWKYNGGSHSLVFSGCDGYTPQSAWSESEGRYTNIEYTEKVAEKPFLVQTAEGEISIFVPDVLENTKGITWQDNSIEDGHFISLDDFYIADEKLDNANTLNKALKSGKHLLFTPGHYSLTEPLKVNQKDTIILGIGYPTLEIADSNDKSAIEIADVDGVRVADILIESGKYSKNMVVVGNKDGDASHDKNPIVLSNVYLRIGGVKNVHTQVETGIVIYANDTICDHFWLWRGDHFDGVEWEDTVQGDGSILYGNPIKTGIEVVGDNVKCYALMVEHMQEYQTYWKGENGMTVMYQSETPYYIPSQDKWMSHDGEKNGFASYKVDDSVNTHRAYGLSIYLVNFTDNILDSAIEVPEKEGIDMQHMVICNFSGNEDSSIERLINNYGQGVGKDNFRSLVKQYPFNY